MWPPDITLSIHLPRSLGWCLPWCLGCSPEAAGRESNPGNGDGGDQEATKNYDKKNNRESVNQPPCGDIRNYMGILGSSGGRWHAQAAGGSHEGLAVAGGEANVLPLPKGLLHIHRYRWIQTLYILKRVSFTRLIWHPFTSSLQILHRRWMQFKLKPKYLFTLTVGLQHKDFVDQCVQKVCFWNLQEYFFTTCLPCNLFNKNGLGFGISPYFNYEACS